MWTTSSISSTRSASRSGIEKAYGASVGRRLPLAASKPSPLGEVWHGTQAFLMSFPCGKHHAHRMRGSHSSEWRLYSIDRDCTDGCLRILPLISQLRQDVFRFRSRNRRCSADEEKLRETLCVSYSSPPRGKPQGSRLLHSQRAFPRFAERLFSCPLKKIRKNFKKHLTAAHTCAIMIPV